MLEDRCAFIDLTRARLRKLRRGSKAWWKVIRSLLGKNVAISSIPSLRGPSGEWVDDAAAKANLLVKTWKDKCKLPRRQYNEYSNLQVITTDAVICKPITPELAKQYLSQLDQASATGPYGIPARILKYMSDVLDLPLSLLANRIVICGAWPSHGRNIVSALSISGISQERLQTTESST